MAHRWADGSWGVRVQGVHKPLRHKQTKLDLNVGDGRYGYRTRPAPEGVTRTEVEGQPLDKSGRKNVAHRKKLGSRLASRAESRGFDGLAEFERVVPSLIEEVRRVASRPRFRARKGQKPRG